MRPRPGIEIDRALQLAHEEDFLLAVDAGKLELVGDLGTFAFIDMAVGAGGGDHGAHQRQREFAFALRGGPG